MVKTPAEYIAGRRTRNHVIARAAREGLIFTRDSSAAGRFRHDGDVSNEWELVTLEAHPAGGPGPRQHRAFARSLPLVR